MDNKNPPALTIIGDVGVDVVLGPIARWPAIGTESLMERSELRAGGSAGNAALAAGFLGAPCRLLSLVGNDSLGTWLTEQFAGLDASLPACDRATSLSIGIIHSCGERTFFTTAGHLPLLSFDTVERSLNLAGMRGGIALIVGGFLTDKLTANYGLLFDWLAEHDIDIALDTGWPITGWTADVIARTHSWLPSCRHLLLNEGEILALTGKSDVTIAVSELQRHVPHSAAIVVKQGARGATGFLGSSMVQVPAPRVELVDSIGAGDVFNAGYLAAIAKGETFEDSIAAGVAIASRAISTHPREFGPPVASHQQAGRGR